MVLWPLDVPPELVLIGRRLARPNSNHRRMLPMSEKKQPAPTMRGDADRLAITSARDD